MQVYRIPIRPQYKRRRRVKRQNPFPKFMLLLAFIVGCVFYIVNHQIESDKAEKIARSVHSPIDFSFNFSPRTQNLLLMGVDSSTNEENPFKDWHVSRICCYRVNVSEGHVTMMTPYVNSILLDVIDRFGTADAQTAEDIISAEQEITDHDLALLEAEQEITDMDLRIMELENAKEE